MYKNNQFDIINVTIPAYGMNQNITPEFLPKLGITGQLQTYWLENIIPLPLGYGQVRFGTRIFEELKLDNDVTIQETFNFTKEGVENLLLYVQEFKRDIIKTGIVEVQLLDNNKIRFKTDNPTFYIATTKIKIAWNFKNENEQLLYTTITDKKIDPENKDYIICTLDDYSFPSNTTNIEVSSIYYSYGKIYLYKKDTKLQLLRENVAINSVPRATTFIGYLIICNGVDPVLKFDGKKLEPIIQLVDEQTVSIKYISSSQVDITFERDWVKSGLNMKKL